ncbi:MAG: tRNA dihydrouridine synthase DusB [Candidatus Omnitrophota bacterium]
MAEIYLTQKGHQKLMEELENLKTAKRREISKAIAAARAHGDISENAEYDAAKDAQGMNEKKIAELEEKLASAHILDEDAMPKDEVLIGATVKLKDMDTGEELEYTLVSEEEADYEENKISVTSPVGAGLLNHKLNAIVEIKIPAGILKYKITGISRGEKEERKGTVLFFVKKQNRPHVFNMLKIGLLKLSRGLILAPMAGISDLSFRSLCRKFGAELAFTEMINARSLSFKSKKTHFMLASSKEDKPLGVQIFGAEEQYILRALEVLRKYDFDVLDFNAACPVRKVVGRGEGAALMKDPKKLNKLLKVIVENTDKPVTVKIRSGWDQGSINAKEVAASAEDAGVKGLFIHGRTRMQFYADSVDYRPIAEVKKAVKIPVIGSGDIFSGALAKKMLDETGCDAVVVARGALGNPWIFKEIKEYLKNGKIIDRPSTKQIIKVMLEHLDALVALHGERIGVVIFRMFFAWYTKGFHNVRPLREKACRAKTKGEMIFVAKDLNKT